MGERESLLEAREAVKLAKLSRDAARARYDEIAAPLIAGLEQAERELDAAWATLRAAFDERDAS